MWDGMRWLGPGDGSLPLGEKAALGTVGEFAGKAVQMCIRDSVECALMIAVGTVLAQIKIFEMPFGCIVTPVSYTHLDVYKRQRRMR